MEDETEDYALDYEQDEFTIDTKNPTIEVTYDNNEVCEEKFFKADRTATIVIR